MSLGVGNGNPLQYSWLENSMGLQRVKHDWATEHAHTSASYSVRWFLCLSPSVYILLNIHNLTKHHNTPRCWRELYIWTFSSCPKLCLKRKLFAIQFAIQIYQQKNDSSRTMKNHIEEAEPRKQWCPNPGPWLQWRHPWPQLSPPLSPSHNGGAHDPGDPRRGREALHHHALRDDNNTINSSSSSSKVPGTLEELATKTRAPGTPLAEAAEGGKCWFSNTSRSNPGEGCQKLVLSCHLLKNKDL